MSDRRVVITGLGVVAPNANGVSDFELALRKGASGIRAVEQMAELKFGCQVAGIPEGADEIAKSYFSEEQLMAMNQAHRYASIAAVDAWTDAGFARPAYDDDQVDWDTGAVLGTGIGGMDTIADRVVPFVNEGRVRRMGSTAVEQVMASGISARVSGLLALGNQVTTNSSACSTGAEAVSIGAERIRAGLAKRMLCGGAEGASVYIWGGFDAMRVLSRKYNDAPERASRPMSASAAGFVPAGGAGVLLVESLESAQERGARIHAELLGTGVNCGGHRGGGSMTAQPRGSGPLCPGRPAGRPDRALPGRRHQRTPDRDGGGPPGDPLLGDRAGLYAGGPPGGHRDEIADRAYPGGRRGDRVGGGGADGPGGLRPSLGQL